MDTSRSEKAAVFHDDSIIEQSKEPVSALHHTTVHGVVDNIQLFQGNSEGKLARSQLLPRPTTDPKDPLTWPTWRKYATFATMSYFVFLSNYITASIAPILVPIVREFAVDATKASDLITFNILFQGIGNLFWVPLARKIGKRPVLLTCSVLYFAATRSWGSLFGARIVQGFSASMSEVFGPSVVADLFFLHQRGVYVGIFTFMIGVGSALGGVFAGLVANANSNWRWVLWMDAILTGILVVATALFQAETNFERPAQFEEDTGIGDEGFAALTSRNGSHWLKSLTLAGWYDRSTPLWWLYTRPLTLVRYPPVAWAALTHGIVLGCVVLQQSTNAIFLPALYHFSELAVGNINIANVIGGIVGCLVGGAASDWMAAWISKRKQGYFKPELRLWCLLPSFIFGPIGIQLWGCGFGAHLSSMTIVAGTGISYAVLCAATATSITYLIDSYRPIAGEVVMILVTFRNTFAFGFSYAIVPWLQKDGFIKVAGWFTLIEGLVFLLAIPMYIYGAKARQWTSKFAI